jgi:TatA/E family protein of Tat protein translocase
MGHWFEILIILALALLVFGPKRMIEMGSSLGKVFRELRNAAKEMDWSSLTGQNETPTKAPSPPPGPRYQVTPTPPVAAPPPPSEEQIVEGSLVDTPDAMEASATPSDSAHDLGAQDAQVATPAPTPTTSETQTSEATERPS